MAKPKSTTKYKAPVLKSKLLRAPSGQGESVATPIEANQPFLDAALITNDRILTILSNIFRPPLINSSEFRQRTILADTIYLETSPKFVLDAILTDPILSPQKYHADIFDCDDYVQYLKTKLSLYAASNNLQAPLAVGYLFTTEHAFTLCIAPGSNLFIINTQSTDHGITNDTSSFLNFLAIRPGNSITAIYI